jgi:hypothetical protein
MGKSADIDFGPLSELIGTWKGQDGVDMRQTPMAKKPTPTMKRSPFPLSAVLPTQNLKNWSRFTIARL